MALWLPYWLVACVVRWHCLLSAPTQDGYLPLIWALVKEAGLQVVATLLEAHPEAAQVADEVRGGAAWETVGLWLCVWERDRESSCVDWYTPICTHIGCMRCVLVRVYKYKWSVYRSVGLCICMCIYVSVHTRLHKKISSSAACWAVQDNTE